MLCQFIGSINTYAFSMSVENALESTNEKPNHNFNEYLNYGYFAYYSMMLQMGGQ